MTDTLEPIHTIPLGPTLTGEVAQAELQFAIENGKPVLYAAVPVWNATWGRWFAWHAPEIMVGVWLVILIVLVRRLLHVRRTPRETGRRYCRRCNHQLTKPQLAFDERGRVQWASANAKCPECGVRTRRVPVRGRSGWVRRLPWIVAALPVLLGLPLLVSSWLERHQPLAFTSVPTWPIQGLERGMGWAALRRRTYPTTVQTSEFWRIDPQSGRVTRQYKGALASQYVRPPFVSPGGKYLVAPSDNPSKLLVLDTATSATWLLDRSEAAFVKPGYFRVLEFLDGTRVFVQRQTNAADSDECELSILHLPNGPFQSIATLSVPRARKARWATHEFNAVASNSRIVWLLESIFALDSGEQLGEIRIPIQNTIKTLTRKPFVSTTRLSLDGTALLLSNDQGGEDAFDLDTGLPVQNPDARVFLRKLEHPTLYATAVAKGLAAISDRERGGALFKLPPITTSFRFPILAPIGRLVAQQGEQSVSSQSHQILTGKPTRLEGEIRIFRIPDPPSE